MCDTFIERQQSLKSCGSDGDGQPLTMPSLDVSLNRFGLLWTAGFVVVAAVADVVVVVTVIGGSDDFGALAVASVTIVPGVRTDVSTAMSFVTFFTATDNDGETEGEENVNEIIMCITYSHNKMVPLLRFGTRSRVHRRREHRRRRRMEE